MPKTPETIRLWPAGGRPVPRDRVPRLDGIEALDEQAKASYRRRLAELEEDLEEARAFNDPQREALLDEEMDALTRELTAAVGLGGANRNWGFPSERGARQRHQVDPKLDRRDRRELAHTGPSPQGDGQDRHLLRLPAGR